MCLAQTSTEALTPEQIAVACAAPPSLGQSSADGLRVIAAQDAVPRALYGQPELLAVNGGSAQGLRVGQQYVVRRLVRFGATYYDKLPHSLHTSGWVKVVAVNDTTAIVMVDHVCSEILQGDFLAPFVPPVVPDDLAAVDTTREPDFSSLGRVLFGSDERQTAGVGQFMLIDRGSEEGVMPGARFALYRDVGIAGAPLMSIGEATAAAIGERLTVVRINRARDAVRTGDLVVPRTK